MKISKSSIETWDRCKRKLAWRKVDGIVFPPSKAAQFGTIFHYDAKHYLDTGFFDATKKTGDMLLSGIHLLPAPLTPGMVTEQYFTVQLADVEFHGYLDLYVWPNFVSDHKTCSDFRWAKTPDELRTSSEGVLYALAGMALGGTDECHLRWNYFRTTGARVTKPVDTIIRKSECVAEAQRLIDVGREIRHALTTIRTALDLPPSPEACEDFGGCPYQQHCNLTPEQKFTAIFSRENLMNQPFDPGAFAAQLTATVGQPNGGFQPAPSPIMGPVAFPGPLPTTPPPQQSASFPAPPQFQPPPNTTQAPPAQQSYQPPQHDPSHYPPVNAPPQSFSQQLQQPPEQPARRGRKPRSARGFTLYVDCYPLGASVEPFAQRLQRVRQIMQQFNQPIGPALSYDLNQHPPQGGIFLSLASQDERECQSILSGVAETTVMAAQRT